MIPQTAVALAAGLKRGEYGDPAWHLLAEAAQLMADELGSPGAHVSALGTHNAVQVLNRHRHFDLARLIGLAWHDTRGCDPRIQKHLAQALVELGGLDAADRLLDEALALAPGSADLTFPAQIPEYQGLRGRIRKQRFVQSRDLNMLREATDAYLAQYDSSQAFWHGVNVLALRLLETRCGLPGQSDAALAVFAHAVLDKAKAARRDPADPWPLATASEACLALSEVEEPGLPWCDQAELWLHRFLSHREATPFAVESYFRQLREVWQGDALRNESCADHLAGIIERHVMRTQRRWTIDPAKAREIASHPEELEKNFSGEKAFTVGDLRRMLALCPNIGCVLDECGVRMGTGFLMPGAAFGLAPELVFVTNAHVISDTVAGAVPPAGARVRFEIGAPGAQADTVEHAIDEMLFTSEPAEVGLVLVEPEKLDVTIVSLKTLPAGVAGLSMAGNIPLPAPKTKAFVVGHPQAGPLQFSINDSVLLDVCPYERLLHYRTPTDPGSSGSPVFNSKWEVVALHHAGSRKAPRLHGQGDYEANEGLSLKAIRLAMHGRRIAPIAI